jgi:hypothetical protein
MSYTFIAFLNRDIYPGHYIHLKLIAHEERYKLRDVTLRNSLRVKYSLSNTQQIL